MKAIFSIIITLLVAFATTLFFEISFINNHWTRQALVLIMLFLEFILCFLFLKSVYTKKK